MTKIKVLAAVVLLAGVVAGGMLALRTDSGNSTENRPPTNATPAEHTATDSMASSEKPSLVILHGLAREATRSWTLIKGPRTIQS